MAKKFIKAGFFALLFAGLTAGAYAQITVSAGFALSYMSAEGELDNTTVTGDIGVGGNVYFDYLLPINIPLSLGFEIGVDTSSLGDDQAMAVPLLLRAAYHFDLFPKLDLYAVGKIGYAIGSIISGTSAEYFDSAGGFAFGIDAGIAYYFTSHLGLFGEVGFDDYMINSKFNIFGTSYSVKTPFYRFVTLGVSFKR
jgi:hypothetical protein